MRALTWGRKATFCNVCTIFYWLVFMRPFFLFAPSAGHPIFCAPSPPRKVLCSVEQRAQHTPWRGAVSGWTSPQSSGKKFLPEICVKKGLSTIICTFVPFGALCRGNSGSSPELCVPSPWIRNGAGLGAQDGTPSAPPTDVHCTLVFPIISYEFPAKERCWGRTVQWQRLRTGGAIVHTCGQVPSAPIAEPP